MNQNTRKTCTPGTIKFCSASLTRPVRLLALSVSVLCAASARGELDFTAEFSPTPGLSGFNTYRITATSDLGNIVGFDFSSSGNYGVTGPINQVNPFGQPTVYKDSFLAGADPLQDSHFLFKCTDVASLFPQESASDLHAAFALIGDRQLSIGNSVPFLQIATQSASDVFLKGSLVVRRPDDQFIEFSINTKLSDITVGAAPSLTVQPVPAPEPVIVTPPVVQPPVQPPSQPVPNPVTPGQTDPTAITTPPEVFETPLTPLPHSILDPTDPVVSNDPQILPNPDWSQPIQILTLSPDGVSRELVVIPYSRVIPTDLIDGLPPVAFHNFDASVDGNAALGYRTAAYASADGVYTSLNTREMSSFSARSILAAADSSPAVPEPTTALLVLIGFAFASTPRGRVVG